MTQDVNAPPVYRWLDEPFTPEVQAAIERVRQVKDVQHVAVMPDVHLAGDVCNGCVIATSELIYPDAVGGDIGCGMAAVAFDCSIEVVGSEQSAARVLAGLYDLIPFNRHSRRTMPALPDRLQQSELSDAHLNTLKNREGRVQFATLGRGNHFVELQGDDQGQLWAMVHTGSRATGQEIRGRHLEHASQTAGGLKALGASEQAGKAYLADAQWAVTYAELIRKAILERISELLQRLFGARPVGTSLVNVSHNHVRQEIHDGRGLWVHRKGANFAGLDAPGLIGGSMGAPSFHVSGRGCKAALCSSSHGAGRTMSRDQARRTFRRKDVEKAMKGIWFDRRRLPDLIDESPAAYKDIQAVMRAQKDLTRIVRTVMPVLCYKGP